MDSHFDSLVHTSPSSSSTHMSTPPVFVPQSSTPPITPPALTTAPVIDSPNINAILTDCFATQSSQILEFQSQVQQLQSKNIQLKNRVNTLEKPKRWDQCLSLKAKLMEKHEIIERARVCVSYAVDALREKAEIIERVRSESTLNAQAVKKFVEENQKLTTECAYWLTQCYKLEKEFSRYDHYQEALMDFENEADNRAKEAEAQLSFYNLQHEGKQAGEMTKAVYTESCLVDTLLSTIIKKDDVASVAQSFLEANSGLEVCQKMLEIWESMNPSTQNIMALASEVKRLHNEKDHLRNNLTTEEEEVKVLFEDLLDKENRRLVNSKRTTGRLYNVKHNVIDLVDEELKEASLFRDVISFDVISANLVIITRHITSFWDNADFDCAAKPPVLKSKIGDLSVQFSVKDLRVAL
ncbi:hypothetical protein R6Q59_000251 [Mikania micrantha]